VHWPLDDSELPAGGVCLFWAGSLPAKRSTPALGQIWAMDDSTVRRQRGSIALLGALRETAP
jgi:hypothetical protein